MSVDFSTPTITKIRFFFNATLLENIISSKIHKKEKKH